MLIVVNREVSGRWSVITALVIRASIKQRSDAIYIYSFGCIPGLGASAAVAGLVPTRDRDKDWVGAGCQA
jgi:hypothetical protein